MKTIASLVTIGLLVVGASDTLLADQHAETRPDRSSIGSWVDSHVGAKYSGPAELWIDPMGNDTLTSDAELIVVDGGLDYSWSFRDTPQQGQIRLGENGIRWQDSWHQPGVVQLTPVPAHGSLLAGAYSYPAGSGPDWHWRIKLSQRPDDTLVLQMTNIAPWGEETRAVRMVFAADEGSE